LFWAPKEHKFAFHGETLNPLRASRVGGKSLDIYPGWRRAGPRPAGGSEKRKERPGGVHSKGCLPEGEKRQGEKDRRGEGQIRFARGKGERSERTQEQKVGKFITEGLVGIFQPNPAMGGGTEDENWRGPTKPGTPTAEIKCAYRGSKRKGGENNKGRKREEKQGQEENGTSGRVFIKSLKVYKRGRGKRLDRCQR